MPETIKKLVVGIVDLANWINENNELEVTYRSPVTDKEVDGHLYQWLVSVQTLDNFSLDGKPLRELVYESYHKPLEA
jgi:hypothetical protein